MGRVSNIIAAAYRDSNLIALGKSPSDAQNTEALALLQTLVNSTVGGTIGYNMQDWSVVSPTSIANPAALPLSTAGIAAFVVPPQARLQCVLTEVVALALDPAPNDGQRFSIRDLLGNFAALGVTLDGNGRLIDGGTSKQFLTDSEAHDYFFRADLGEWVELSNLDIDGDFPFPAEFDDFFIIGLAMRLDPRYGAKLSELQAAVFAEQKAQLIDNYRQSRLRMKAQG